MQVINNMNLSELKLLIDAGQVVEIIMTGHAVNGGYNYDLYIETGSSKISDKLKTGRTHTDKVYSSIDRAVRAIEALGYVGEYTIKYNRGV